MSNGIPKRPATLVEFLGNLITGDDKHQQDGPLPKDVRASLEATKAKLELLNGQVQTSRGQLRQATHDRRDYLNTAMELADKFRAQVVGILGSKGSALVDYALAPRRKPHKAGSVQEAGSSPEIRKEERAKLHLAGLMVRREKEMARMSKLDELISAQKAKVAKAPEVTLPEPSPSSEPTSESGTK